MALKTKLAQDLQTAEETVQQLQDQLATTSSSYEKQLSTMSDHLCELNDRLLKQSDELDVLRKSAKVVLDNYCKNIICMCINGILWTFNYCRVIKDGESRTM